MSKIIGNNDGSGGRNETYQIGARKEVSRVQAVREVKQGLHKDTHVVTINNQEYVRDNPDRSKADNVNRKK
jgi:dTDP-D-glucose 4,6-dehydratase